MIDPALYGIGFVIALVLFIFMYLTTDGSASKASRQYDSKETRRLSSFEKDIELATTDKEREAAIEKYEEESHKARTELSEREHKTTDSEDRMEKIIEFTDHYSQPGLKFDSVVASHEAVLLNDSLRHIDKKKYKHEREEIAKIIPTLSRVRKKKEFSEKCHKVKSIVLRIQRKENAEYDEAKRTKTEIEKKDKKIKNYE